MNGSNILSNDRLKAWYQASRPPFYIATVIPLVLGWVLAVQDAGEWRFGRFFLVNLGAFMVHLATNLADDLFDHILGADAGDSIGGSRVVQEGKITLGQLAWSLVILYSAALVIAAALIKSSGQAGLWGFVVFAALSSLFYVAPPIKYGYRGLGELSVFINMGLIMVGGAYWVQAEAWNWKVIWPAIPVGLMVANILYFQSLPDMATDEKAGKITLAVRLGKEGAEAAFKAWWIITYISIILLNMIGMAGLLAWACLLTIPLYLKTARLIHETEDWLDLDAHGHLVRKLYMTNGVIIILSVII